MADPLDGWFDDSGFSLPPQVAPDPETYPTSVFDADEIISSNLAMTSDPPPDPCLEDTLVVPEDLLPEVPSEDFQPRSPEHRDCLSKSEIPPTLTSPPMPLEPSPVVVPDPPTCGDHTCYSQRPMSPILPRTEPSPPLSPIVTQPMESSSTPAKLCKPVMLEELCRLCLVRSNGEMQNLFEDETVLEDIWTLVQLELHEGDGMPDHICQQCILQVKSALEFISQCRSSDLMLRDYLNKLKLARTLNGTDGDDAGGCLMQAVLQRELDSATFARSPDKSPKTSAVSLNNENAKMACEAEKSENSDAKEPSPMHIPDFGQNSILSRLLQRPPSRSSILPPFSSNLERTFSTDRSFASHDPEQSFTSHIHERSLSNSNLEESVASAHVNNSYSSHNADHSCDDLRRRWEAEGTREAEESNNDIILLDDTDKETEMNNNVRPPGSVKIICVQINDPAKITNGRIVNLNRSMKINDSLNVPMYVLSNDSDRMNSTDEVAETTPAKIDDSRGESRTETDDEADIDVEMDSPMKCSPHLRDAHIGRIVHNGTLLNKTYYYQRGLENGRHAIYLNNLKESREEQARLPRQRQHEDARLPQHKEIRPFLLNNPNYEKVNGKTVMDTSKSTKRISSKRKYKRNEWRTSALCQELLSHNYSAKHEQALTVCVTSTDSVNTVTEGDSKQEGQPEETSDEVPAENGAVTEESPADPAVEYVLAGEEPHDGVQYVLYSGSSGENGDAESYILPGPEPPAAGKSFGNSEILYFDVQEEVVVETDDQGEEEEVPAVEVQQVQDQAEPEPGVSGECVYEVKTEPTEEYPFVCEICGKAFKRRNALLSHMKLHTFINFGAEHEHRKNVFKCDVCFKCYISKTGLNMHRSRVHETGSVPCPECEESFTSRSQLAQHLKVHSQREYKCNRCFKTFQKRKTFVAHTQVHVQIVYKCDTCLRMFNLEEELNEHVKSHQAQEAATGSAQPTAPRSDAQVEQFQRMKFEYCLSYVGLVKSMFHDQPDMYAGFLDTIKDFKFQKINVQGLLVRISQLFKDHRELIAGFNTFMPHGFKIELPADDRCQPEGSGLLEEPAQGPDMDLDYSLSYLSQIKSMFANQPKIYNDFTYIIKEYKLQTMEIPEVIRRVSHLFRNYPELIAGFNSFLPPWCKINVNSNDKKEKEDIDPRDATPGTSTEPAVPCNGDAKRKTGKRKSATAADASKKIKIDTATNSENSTTGEQDASEVTLVDEFQLQIKVEDEPAEAETLVEEAGENHTYVHEEAEEAAPAETFVVEAEEQPAEEFFITVSNEVAPATSGVCSFVCHVCLQTFKQREALHDHMKTHGK